MFYLITQYKILKFCLFYWIKEKQPKESSLNVKLDYLYKKLRLPKKSIYYHVMTLSECGYLNHIYEKDNSHSFKPTKDGWHYYLNLKSKLWRIAFDCIWAIILVVIGFLIGI